jgi:regulator of replication initiation timing
MTVERKIRELLAGKQAITEASDGDMTAPKQGSSVTSSSEKMGASNGKDTSKAAKSNTSGDQTQPRQGSSADAPHQDRDGDADENQGAKVAVNAKDTSDSSGPASGPGDAPNFKTVADPRSVVNQPSSKGNVHKEEVEPEDDDLIEDDIEDEDEEEVEDAEEDLEEDFSAELATLFDGNEDLTEEFRGKAASLFEAMVSASVNVKAAALEEALIQEAAALMEEFKDDLVEKVDSYLTYVAEQYIAENELAVENGLRADITESFIAGLKNLFSEHYIEVPEEKYDVLGEMQVEIEELQSRVDQTMTANVELHAENTKLQRESVLIAVTENLAKTDAEKFVSIVADVEFENAEIFEEKLNVIRENYFPKAQPNTEEKMTDGLDETSAYAGSPLMEKYTKVLDKMSTQI